MAPSLLGNGQNREADDSRRTSPNFRPDPASGKTQESQNQGDRTIPNHSHADPKRGKKKGQFFPVTNRRGSGEAKPNKESPIAKPDGPWFRINSIGSGKGPAREGGKNPIRNFGPIQPRIKNRGPGQKRDAFKSYGPGKENPEVVLPHLQKKPGEEAGAKPRNGLAMPLKF